jgi:xylulose-5-phosphate/fructose-6-phosphate phosphoketolase
MLSFESVRLSGKDPSHVGDLTGIRVAAAYTMSRNSEFAFDASVSSAVRAAEFVRRDESRRTDAGGPLSTEMLARVQRWWDAANYLTIGQIFLQANPLLRRPLRPEHIKPRLLGHWGTSPGLSLLYVHLNRLIREHGIEVMYLAGPGHGGPAIVAGTYLDGTYSEVYPPITRDEEGLRRLFRQFSTPGGIPSHVSV